jgi:hypothetical protein
VRTSREYAPGERRSAESRYSGIGWKLINNRLVKGISLERLSRKSTDLNPEVGIS